MFPMPPEGWGSHHGAFADPLPRRVVTTRSGKKVLFEPATFPQQWLKGASRSGSIALLVANLRGREVTPEVLERTSATGGLAVCSLGGMLATNCG